MIVRRPAVPLQVAQQRLRRQARFFRARHRLEVDALDPLGGAVVGFDRLDEFADAMRSRIVSVFTDALASSNVPVLDIAARYSELGDALLPVINPQLTAKYGIEMPSFIVENVSVPPEVEQAIDKRSSMAAIGNLNDYVKFQMEQVVGSVEVHVVPGQAHPRAADSRPTADQVQLHRGLAACGQVGDYANEGVSRLVCDVTTGACRGGERHVDARPLGTARPADGRAQDPPMQLRIEGRKPAGGIAHRCSVSEARRGLPRRCLMRTRDEFSIASDPLYDVYIHRGAYSDLSQLRGGCHARAAGAPDRSNEIATHSRGHRPDISHGRSRPRPNQGGASQGCRLLETTRQDR